MEREGSVELHRQLGGNQRVDFRRWNDPVAVRIRSAVMEINQSTGENEGEMAKRFGVSESTMSLAMGGRAGVKTMERLAKEMVETSQAGS